MQEYNSNIVITNIDLRMQVTLLRMRWTFKVPLIQNKVELYIFIFPFSVHKII